MNLVSFLNILAVAEVLKQSQGDLCLGKEGTQAKVNYLK